MSVAHKVLVGLFGLLGLLALHYAGAPIPWPPFADHLYEALDFAAAACCLWRAATYQPERWAWLAIGLGALSFAFADVYYAVFFSDAETVPFPSVADALYLGLYPGCYVGLVLLLKRRAGGLTGGAWLDGLIGALGFAALAAALLIGAVVTDTGGDPLTVIVNIAFPLGDVLLVALVVGTLAVFGRRGRTWATIAASFTVFAVVDAIYLYQVAEGTYAEGALLDAGWPCALLLLAVAAWQRPALLERRGVARARMVIVPAAAGIGSLAILVTDHYARVNEPALWLASACILAGVVRFGMTFLENLRVLRLVHEEATTDALTGLGNRRLLTVDLERQLADGGPATLTLFDLDGFKTYNDTFGHPAGDLLLQRLGARLAAAVRPTGGRAYRMGGDEFCVLGVGRDDTALARAVRALSETGDGFAISASHGTVEIPAEAASAAVALTLADQRMYAHKRSGRASAGRQSRDVLLRAVRERNPDLGDHVRDVGDLAESTARRLGVPDEALAAIRHGAELHDIGKLAIPDQILNKPGPLDEAELAFMRRHTVIGERIVAAAPALAEVARLVRSSHEHYDGGGYPDRLAGEQIPLGARIIAVCDAWDAMTTDRPYRRAMSAADALAELRRCAGTQFDPAVVDAFCATTQSDSSRRMIPATGIDTQSGRLLSS